METKLEYTLLNGNKKQMLAYVDSHPDSITELITLALADKQPYSWRAAWLIRSCIKKNDKRLKKVIPKIIKALSELPESQKRDLLFVLHKMDLKEKEEGIVFDMCVDIWCNLNAKPAARLTAFKMMLKVLDNHPELYNEIILLSGEHYTESLSPGVKHSINKLLKTLKQNHNLQS